MDGLIFGVTMLLPSAMTMAASSPVSNAAAVAPTMNAPAEITTFVTSASASASASSPASSPTMASVDILANVTDPSVDRDSCGSCLFGDRILWTCRDTMGWNASANSALLPILSNSASWTNSTTSGPDISTVGPVGAGSNGSNPIVFMYGNQIQSGKAFFPVSADECPYNGDCSDGSRWAVWPDSPPLVTQRYDNGTEVAYSWIRKMHLANGLTQVNSVPPFTLFRVTYTPSDDPEQMPSVDVVDEDFWQSNTIGFGDYGGLVVNDTAYLYGQTDQGLATVLARVPVDSIEDSSAYQYYINDAWSTDAPGLNDTAAAIPNAGAGGQGSFYYDRFLQSYVWIGQANVDTSAHILVSTAPQPWGPWVEPYSLWNVPLTNGTSGYSVQVNPALKPANDDSNGVYITWTEWNSGLYTTPLALLKWSTS